MSVNRALRRVLERRRPCVNPIPVGFRRRAPGGARVRHARLGRLVSHPLRAAETTRERARARGESHATNESERERARYKASACARARKARKESRARIPHVRGIPGAALEANPARKSRAETRGALAARRAARFSARGERSSERESARRRGKERARAAGRKTGYAFFTRCEVFLRNAEKWVGPGLVRACLNS